MSYVNVDMGRKRGKATISKGAKANLVGIRGRHLSYKRSRHTTHPATSLIKIEGVDDAEAARYV